MGGRWQTSVGELLRARTDDDHVALTWCDTGGTLHEVTWAEHVRRSADRATWLADRLAAEGGDAGGRLTSLERVAKATTSTTTLAGAPRHIGILMDNIPEFSYFLGAAALAGLTVVGLNPTRGPIGVVRDAHHTDCALILTEDKYLAHLIGVGIPVVSVDEPRSYKYAEIPDAGDQSDTPFMLILTSGTTTAPKAVVCTQGKLATQGSKAAQLRGLTSQDVLYCAMPLFHSNAIILSWIPALATGAALALRRKFSASAFLPDVRCFQATYANYVGKPLAYVLATPELPDDADNPLRQVFGNEAAPADTQRFAKRFGCQVTDGFGSTEGGITFIRTADTPPAALGIPASDVRVIDPETGRECERAVLDETGRLGNPDAAIGEMVNFDGAGAFEGYYGNAEADRSRIRDGRFWSGDLAYRDAGGVFYFAGRSGDWIRVNGENFAAAPITRAIEEWPGAILAVAYGVPDAAAGDQVMVAIEMQHPFDPDDFAAYLDARGDIPPLWRPRYVRVVKALPQTATNKVVVRDLLREAWLGDADGDGDGQVFIRDTSRYRPLTKQDRKAIAAEFAHHGRTPPAASPAPPVAAPAPLKPSRPGDPAA